MEPPTSKQSEIAPASTNLPKPPVNHVQSKLGIVSFNCKNIKTSGPFFNEISKSTDIVLIQEHWLFDYELHLLNEIHEKFTGVGKSIDSDVINEVNYSKRGYGGVAILWSKDIDKYIKSKQDGNERIQCIEINIEHPILLISVYLPTKMKNDRYEEYSECIDQIFEIIQTYQTTHEIIVGGDMNEDISKMNNSRRAVKLRELMTECNLTTNTTGPTFMNVKGVEVSEIDYFLYQKDLDRKAQRLSSLTSNVSDHHPLKLTVTCQLTKAEKKVDTNNSKRTRWEKVDKQQYQTIISEKIVNITNELNEGNDLDTIINSTMELLHSTAKSCSSQRDYGKNRLKLKLWNNKIAEAIHINRDAHKQWKHAGRPNNPEHPLVINKRETRKDYRRELRIEENRRKHEDRNNIITADAYDKRLFFKLVKKHRKTNNCFIEDLYVGNNLYQGENVINGWHQHFKAIAEPEENPSYNQEHLDLCEMDYDSIKLMCKQVPSRNVTKEEISEAIKSLNRGKSEDIFGLSVENIIYAGSEFTDFLHLLINHIFQNRLIPDVIKLGLLSPIYKNKGEKHESKNYRGITVLPVFIKIIEHIARIDLKPKVATQQSKIQRGFTENTSPLNAAVIVEEIYREYEDTNKPFYIALLDAKSAFDVVVLKMLMRKVYLMGLNLASWAIIDDLHSNTRAAIKWNNCVSDQYQIYQGVKQGGLLSADLYKIYIEDLLTLFENTHIGCKIGDINVNSVACADDIALISENRHDLQLLLNYSEMYSSLHHYTLQPQKSVIIPINQKPKNVENLEFKLKSNVMPVVEKSAHLGISRSTSKRKTDGHTIEQNITKARRTSYSLMNLGLHGNNGLDPTTSTAIIKCYVLPVLTYGIEILQPTKANLDKMEHFLKSLLKRILSLPPNSSDAALYVITGILPIEAQLDLKSLTLFNNICRQDPSSLEKAIAIRQSQMKDQNSSSWFIGIKNLLMKYSLKHPLELLNSPPSKHDWKRTIKEQVNSYWRSRIIHDCTLYTKLRFLNFEEFKPNNTHSITYVDKSSDPSREAIYIANKLKIVTGAYILQSDRAKYGCQESTICKLCDSEREDVTHFILDCKILDNVRNPYLEQLNPVLKKSTGKQFSDFTKEYQLQILLDCTKIQTQLFIDTDKKDVVTITRTIEHIARRLCFSLHTTRYRSLDIKRKR